MWDKYYSNRKGLIGIFILLALVSVLLLPRLKFAFNFEQFFPQGDSDLEFFRDFVKEFETDDNFLLIALDNQPSIFDTSFLKKVKSFSYDCKRKVPYFKSLQSLTQFEYPVLTPFGPTTIPAVHVNDPDKLRLDSTKIVNDERLLYTLINKEGSSTIVLIKTEDNIELEASNEIMESVKSLLLKHDLNNHHFLGRAYFQAELAYLQFKEILISTIVSGILICIVMVLIFKRWTTILISLGSIGIGLLIFMGLLSLWGRELSIMAALYPILMLIVGTSDVVHIMTKYLDELKKGLNKEEALRITVRQIGMATLLTSLTTAAGFATLLSSRIGPIQEFGINSAIGVILAFIVVIGFTCPLMTFFSKESIIQVKKQKGFWPELLERTYTFSLNKSTWIYWGSIVFLVFTVIGISKIHTNYDLYNNLPKGAKITEDFAYFEESYAGFRPLELAGTIQEGYEIYDLEVITEIDKAEQHLKSRPEIQTATSISTLVKSINQMIQNSKPEAYALPEKKDYRKVRKYLSRVPKMGTDALISKDKSKTRISSKIKDVGAANIKVMRLSIDDWLEENIDTSVIEFKQTGTGLLLDKNSEFVKESLLEGLVLALLIVSLMMGFLFKNIKMLFLAIVPNVIPLLFAAALIGYFDVALEAGTSIVFAIIFGIAVDDTIHFLSKYKLAHDQYNDREKALQITFQECGKAIIFTSIILFFGFLVLLFSSNQPSVIIGMLISTTLLSALIADFTILPVLIRLFKI